MAGLSTRTVKSVAVDPFTGAPIPATYDEFGRANNYQSGELPYRPLNGAGPPQGTKHNRGVPPAWDNDNSEPWPGEYDQTAYQNGRVVDKYTIASNPPSEFSQAYVDGMGQPGANQGTGAERAIDIVIRGGAPGAAFTGGWGSNGFGYQVPMQWEDTPSAPAPEGDPWGGLRIGEQDIPNQPGMTTGSAPNVAAALAARQPGPRRLSPAIHAALMAQQTYKKVGRPGGSFLETRGVDTSRLTAGELANALSAATGSSDTGNPEFHYQLPKGWKWDGIKAVRDKGAN